MVVLKTICMILFILFCVFAFLVCIGCCVAASRASMAEEEAYYDYLNKKLDKGDEHESNIE